MPSGRCAICSQSNTSHALDCERWRAAPNRSYRNSTSGRGGRTISAAIDLSVKQTKAKLRSLIQAAESSYQNYVLTRYQASTGVVVLRHADTRVHLDRAKVELERHVARAFPPPDGAEYEVMPRATLRLRLTCAKDGEECRSSSTSQLASGSTGT